METKILIKIYGMILAFLYLFPALNCSLPCSYKQHIDCSMAENVVSFVRFNFENFLDYLSIVSYDLYDRNVHKTAHDIVKLMKAIKLEREEKSFYLSIKDLRSLKANVTRDVTHFGGNTIAVVSSDNTSNWLEMFQWMSNTRVNSGLVVIAGKLNNSTSTYLNRVVHNISINSMFYQTHIHENNPESPTWNQVIALKGYERGILNHIKFDLSGRIVENFDMQGINIIGLALSWEPYFSIESCTDMKPICMERSYLAEVMDIMGDMMNFTWEAHRQHDDNWGTSPISGPANSSGVWGGMMGDIFYGKYQLSISTWRWTPSRDDMFDFAHILDDRKVLVALGDIGQQDVGIFIKPFNKNAWVFFLLTMSILLVTIVVLFHLKKRYFSYNKTFKKVSRIVIFFMWFCYTMVEIYYEGALTMFFSTQSRNPFENIKDVIRAYPDWKLLMQKGTDIYFLPSLNGNYSDGDYVAFWQRVKDFPEDSVYSGFEKTAKERMHDSVVLHVSQSAVNVFKKNSRGEEADSLEVFGEGSYDYFGLITTKNSPLGVILRHGSSIMSERGVFSYLKTKWLSNYEGSCSRSSDSDKTVVTISHVSLAFTCYAFLILVCMALLTCEIFFARLVPQNILSSIMNGW